MQLNQAILYEGTVAEELKMLVSLIASQAAGCLYCQAHMANLSSIYKASGEKIAAVWEFETSDLFNEAEKAALRLAMKASISPNQAAQEDFDELALMSSLRVPACSALQYCLAIAFPPPLGLFLHSSPACPLIHPRSNLARVSNSLRVRGP